MAGQTRCDRITRVLLLIEDDAEQRMIVQEAAQRYFPDNTTVGCCVAQSVDAALAQLQKYTQVAPEARLYAVLDYNMGLNIPGQRRPTEALFYDQTFQHFLNNGGVVILYSGYPEQVLQSVELLEIPQKYTHLALLHAKKSTIPVDDVFRFLQGITVEIIPKLKEIAEKNNYNLGKILDMIRNQAG